MSELAKTYPAHIATLCARHDAALERSGHDHLVIQAGSPHFKFLDDNAYAFEPNPHFKSWVPLLSHPESLLVYTPGEQPVLACYQPVDYWHLPPEAPEGHWVDHFDIRCVRDPGEALSHLPASGRIALVGEGGDGFQDLDANPDALLAYLHYHRAAKTDYELECMRRATARAVDGHRAAERAFREGASEFGIHIAYLAAAESADAELPYSSIVALNEHGATLHYQHLDRAAPAAIRSFLIDAGAGHLGYAADITRTYAAQEDEFAELIRGMEALQQSICSEVRAGVDYRDLHLGCHARIAALLLEHGIVSGLDAQSVVETGISTAFFPHGLGHYLGLQVHDVGGFMANDAGELIDKPEGHPFLRLTRTLGENEVLTIEPGLYFIDMLLAELRERPAGSHVDWSRVERLRPYGGIRIEDNVAVRGDGCENFTRDAFAHP